MNRIPGLPLPERDAHQRDLILRAYKRRHLRRLRRRRPVFALWRWTS